MINRIPKPNTDEALIEEFKAKTKRLQLKSDEQAANIGYVYIASNVSLADMVKIGATTKQVDERLTELSNSTSIPTPFKEEYSFLVEDPKQIETQLFRRLRPLRINPKREFFNLTPMEAWRYIAKFLYKTENPLIVLIHEATKIMEFLDKYPNRFEKFDPLEMEILWNELKECTKKLGERLDWPDVIAEDFKNRFPDGSFFRNIKQ